MGYLLTALLVFTLPGSPLLLADSGGKPLEQPNLEINLSIDLNSRDLVESALGQVQDCVSAVVYKFDDPKLLPILKETLKRGVDLRILCDEKESDKKKSLIAELAETGAQVRVWPRSQGKLHAKFMICDDNRVLSGSWNWTRSAGESNLELLLDIKDVVAVERFQELFTRLWEMGKPITDR